MAQGAAVQAQQFRIARRDAQPALVGGRAFRVAAQQVEHVAEVLPGRGAARVELLRRLQHRDRLLQPTRALEHDAVEIGQGEVLGAAPVRHAGDLGRLLGLAGGGEGQGARPGQGEGGGAVLHRLGEGLRRLGMAARPGQQRSEVLPVRRAARAFREAVAQRLLVQRGRGGRGGGAADRGLLEPHRAGVLSDERARGPGSIILARSREFKVMRPAGAAGTRYHVRRSRVGHSGGRSRPPHPARQDLRRSAGSAARTGVLPQPPHRLRGCPGPSRPGAPDLVPHHPAGAPGRCRQRRPRARTRSAGA